MKEKPSEWDNFLLKEPQLDIELYEITQVLKLNVTER